jgi:hypothetical protein
MQMITHFYTAAMDEYDAAISNNAAIDEGNAGFVFSASSTATIPLYRSRSAKSGGHFYTTFIDERDVATNEEGHVGEGIACYCFSAGANAAQATQPLFRGYNATTDDHLYSLDENEIVNAIGYVAEGVACDVLVAGNGTAGPLYRFRVPNSSMHFYTASEAERTQVLAAQYVPEGQCGFVFQDPSPGPAPLFRSCKLSDGAHLYTMDIGERDRALTIGFRGDGIAGYIYALQAPGSQELYRAYSPTLDDHFYTIDKMEHDNAVEKLGYSEEGVTGWVLTAMAAAAPGAAELHRLRGDFSGDFLVPFTAPKGLTSNSNYVFNSVIGASCNPIAGVSVMIDVATPIVLKSNSLHGKATDTSGFGFQLNAYSLTGFTCAYQQYVIALVGDELQWKINNEAVDTSNSILTFGSLKKLSKSALPAHYKLTISLQTDDTNSVTGATFAIADEKGNPVANATQVLENVAGIGPLGIAPIAGFTVDFVGPEGGVQATLEAGGSGTITCSAASPLTAALAPPSCAQVPTRFTEETANSVYGMVSASTSKSFVQSFNTNGTTF